MGDCPSPSDESAYVGNCPSSMNWGTAPSLYYHNFKMGECPVATYYCAHAGSCPGYTRTGMRDCPSSSDDSAYVGDCPWPCSSEIGKCPYAKQLSGWNLNSADYLQ